RQGGDGDQRRAPRVANPKGARRGGGPAGVSRELQLAPGEYPAVAAGRQFHRPAFAVPEPEIAAPAGQPQVGGVVVDGLQPLFIDGRGLNGGRQIVEVGKRKGRWGGELDLALKHPWRIRWSLPRVLRPAARKPAGH